MKGRLRRALSRWADNDDQLARELQAEYVGEGDLAIIDAPDRAMVTLRGTLKSVTVRPQGGVPALEGELFDGSGSIAIIWLGRHRIAGIDPGRSLKVQGRVCTQHGVRLIYNPRYELLG